MPDQEASMRPSSDPQPYDWHLSAVITRFVIGVVIGAVCGLGFGIRQLGFDIGETGVAIIACAIGFGVASSLFGDRFWKSFLSMFSRE